MKKKNEWFDWKREVGMWPYPKSKEAWIVYFVLYIIILVV